LNNFEKRCSVVRANTETGKFFWIAANDMIDVRLTILSLPKELGAGRNLQGLTSLFNMKTLRTAGLVGHGCHLGKLLPLLTRLYVCRFWMTFRITGNRPVRFDALMFLRKQGTKHDSTQA
jgi:hypothetical protein